MYINGHSQILVLGHKRPGRKRLGYREVVTNVQVTKVLVKNILVTNVRLASLFTFVLKHLLLRLAGKRYLCSSVQYLLFRWEYQKVLEEADLLASRPAPCGWAVSSTRRPLSRPHASVLLR